MTTTTNPAKGVVQATPFTPAEITDIRRFAGFPAFASLGYYLGGGLEAYLDMQIANMSDQEQTIVRTVYLANLTALEAAVVTAGAFLGTDQAAVWKRNRTEAADRQALFRMKRLEMCAFIGITPGPGVSLGGGKVTRG